MLDPDHFRWHVIRAALPEAAVAFRGTQLFVGFDPADVFSNLWIRHRPWDPGRVHRGYRETLLDAAQEIKRALYSDKRPLYFTGHSMGGALATLASTLPPGYRHGGRVWHLSVVGNLTAGLPPGWHFPIPTAPKAFAKAVLDHRVGEYARKLRTAKS